MRLQHTPSAPPNYAVLLWDNDGVLVDTERLHFQSTRDVFAQAGIDLTIQHYIDYFLKRSGGTSTFAAAHGLSEADIAAIKRARNARYLHLLESEPITISGVRETLLALRPHFVMGIVTSSRRQHLEAMHQRTGLLAFFDFIVAREDYKHSKPAPDPYLSAIDHSGIAAGRCLAIEDAPRGVTAARAAKLDCWVIPTALTGQATFTDATRILDRITDVESLLRPKTLTE
ncbi:HAD family hydrolase [Veronia pacifica]|uniref:HAD family hydrolase n=1 Tax=Veronia pacifica TaxID=1080227 RepID=A0A1C3ESV7_9GAMM|nr:HAD family phosphatase [Veronia pacifica]ODA36284.1 hypothetical protein A8L45_01410 [Veronia pacifica]